MRILLIEPAKPKSALGGEDVFIYEPLALEYVAAGVSTEHEVRILDLRIDKDLDSVLEDFQPEIVGITAYTLHVNVVKDLFEHIKAWNLATLTVVGGHHATVVPDDFITPFIDLIVIGEGVHPFHKIVNRHARGELFDGIPGVATANGKGLKVTDPHPDTDLDELPFPDRGLTKEYRKHYYSEWMRPLASIRTSKGCPYRCNFCALWKLTGGRYFKRGPEKIVEELVGIEEEYIFFADDESLLDTKRMSKLASLIKEKGIQKRYFLYARSDTIAKNPDLLKQWREIGLERVFVGIEFCDDEDLNYIGKRSTSEDNVRAVHILHDLGIDVYASFILRPEFTSEDFADLRKYCRQLQLCFASFAVLTPLPGTDLYHEVRDQMIQHNYDYFDFIHTLLPTKLPLKQFYEEYYNLYTKGISLRNQLSHLSKFPLAELPGLMVKGRQFYSQLRRAYNDY
jgi:radical SAM superfamily enzyme YgiQ (UPF0313 family)